MTNYQPKRTGNAGAMTKVACARCGRHASLRAFVWANGETYIAANGEEFYRGAGMVCRKACESR